MHERNRPDRRAVVATATLVLKGLAFEGPVTDQTGLLVDREKDVGDLLLRQRVIPDAPGWRTPG